MSTRGVSALEQLVADARAAFRRGEYRHAHELTMEGAQYPPQRFEDAVGIGSLLRLFEEYGEFANLLSKDLPKCSDHRQWYRLCVLASAMGEIQKARQMLEGLVQQHPDYADALYGLGVNHMFAGELESAEHFLERCIAIEPRHVQAHWMLSRVRPDPGRISRLTRLIRLTAPASWARVYLGHALHNELHAVGSYDEAWAALSLALEARRALVPFDGRAARSAFEQLMSTFTPSFLSSEPYSEQGPAVIFVIGMHRSGTSLLEQLLAAHPDIAVGGESYIVPVKIRLEANCWSEDVLGADVLAVAESIDYGRMAHAIRSAYSQRARGKLVMTEKLPPNFLNVGFVAKALPDARFINVVRHPMDVCFSNMRTLFTRRNGFSCDQSSLAQWHQLYCRLMAHWHAVLPDRVIDVSYSALAADPVAELRRVLDFCGLSPVAELGSLDRTQVVATASAPELAQGKITYRTAAWEPYGPHLAELKAGLSLSY